MRLYVHTVVVKVATTDPNPASAAATVESQIAGTDPSLIHWQVEPVANEPKVATIPDRPDTTVEAYDDWMNGFVLPLFS